MAYGACIFRNLYLVKVAADDTAQAAYDLTLYAFRISCFASTIEIGVW